MRDKTIPNVQLAKIPMPNGSTPESGMMWRVKSLIFVNLPEEKGLVVRTLKDSDRVRQLTFPAFRITFIIGKYFGT